MLGLEIPRRSPAVNLGWLLLVPCLGLTEASCCLFDRPEEVVKHESRPPIHMEKQLGWACKSGGAESLGISKAGQTLLARLMESQIWHPLASCVALWLCVWEDLEKGQWPLLALIPGTSLSPSVLVPFKLLPQCWSSEGVSLSR